MKKATNYLNRMTMTVLKNNEAARDDMMIVVKTIHDFEMSMFSIEKVDYYQNFFDGKLSSIKTIDRIWRRVQEVKPELRGKDWVQRQAQAGLIALESLISKQQLDLFNHG